MRNIRKDAAPTEAKILLLHAGKEFVYSYEFNVETTPVFAKVSPKRHKGPCNNAGPTPL
jgi:hypothetical protein